MNSNLMLTIGGLVLLSTLIIAANRFILNQKTLALESEYVMTAISLGQSIINEAKEKSFDEVADTGKVYNPNQLTLFSSFGPDAGESIPLPDSLSNSTYLSALRYNDVDDYNGYSRRISTITADNYLATVSVTYASPTYPDSVLTTKTWCKKMTVTVTNPYITIPIRLSYSFTY